MNKLRLHFFPFEKISLGLLATAGIFLLADSPTPYARAQEARNAYEHLLDTLAQVPIELQISTLQSFIEEHPRHERAFLKLLERHLFHQKSAAAQSYFQTLARDSSQRGASAWMLAKLAVFTNDFVAAETLYATALRATDFPPSHSLLKDYFEFRHQQSGPLEARAELRRLALPAEQQKIAAALLQYYNEQYADALAAFHNMPTNLKREEGLLEIWGECAYRNEHAHLTRRLALADSSWRAGLALAQQRENREAQMRFYLKLGKLAQRQEFYQLARARYDSALALARQTADAWNLPEILHAQGNLRYLDNDYPHADSLYRTAIDLATRMRATKTLADLYLDYSQIPYENSRYQNALEVLTLSEQYARAARDMELLIRARLKRARIYLALARNSEAQSLVQQARAQAQSQHYLELRHRAAAMLADIMLAEGDYAGARTLYEKYLRFLNDNGNRFERHNYMAKIADTYKGEGLYQSARAWYLRALQEATAIQARRNRLWYLGELINLEITVTENFSEIIARLQALYPQVNELNDAGLLVSLGIGFGMAYKGLEDYDSARVWYQRAATHIEQIRSSLRVEGLRLGYFRERSLVYQELVECYFHLYHKNKSAAALDSLFHFIQMSQGRTLHEALSDKSLATHDEADPAYRSYQEACTRLRSIQRDLRGANMKSDTALLEKWEDARREVMERRLRLLGREAGFALNPAAITLSRQAALQSLKQKQAALLLYHLGADTTFAIVAAHERLHLVPLRAHVDTLEALVHALLLPLHHVHADSIKRVRFHADVAYQLYQQLLRPIEAAVPLPKRLIIVPALVVAELPFEMLLMRPPQKSAYLPGDPPSYAQDFLLHQYDLTYSPSVKLMEENPAARAAASGVLVFANPMAQALTTAAVSPSVSLRTGWNFRPLPHAEIEAEGVKKVYSRAEIFARDAATKSAFQEEAEQRGVLHFATHAFVDSVFDAFSGLVLAVSERAADDGLLMGYEIADMNLPCDLVALSACETGLGEFAEGEGVLGLPRLFLRAGAKSVLMTLWQVHDEFAAKLMPRFYDYHFNDGLAKVEALAQAKRALMREKDETRGVYFQHPFFWAAFALYGDPGAAEPTRFTPANIAILLVLLVSFAAAWYVYARARKAL